MQVLAREGSIAKDVAALAPLLTDQTWPSFAFCTDDRNPLEIAEEGHIDFAIRKAIRCGAPPVAAYRAASFAAARAFGLFDRGQIAPGRRADIVLLDDLESCAVSTVICGGVLIDEAAFEGRSHPAPVGYGSVRRAPVTPDLFEVRAAGPSGPVIGALENSLLTEHLTMTLPWRDGLRLPDPGAGVHKLAVLERHGKNGNVGRAFVKGFGALRGALASQHRPRQPQHHRGRRRRRRHGGRGQPADRAAGRRRRGRDGAVRAELALPIAGLMSDRPFEEVQTALRTLRSASRAMGCALGEPFLQLAFLPLPVIPHLKLTDKGLVDVDRFELIAA